MVVVAPGPSQLSIALNLFLAAAGAGLLSFAYLIFQVGIIFALFLTLLFAFITVLADFILIQTSALFRGAIGGEGTLEALTQAALGPSLAHAVAASVVLGVLGGATGYLIIIGDLAVPPLRHAFSCSPAGDTRGVCMLATREALIPLAALCVALPLSSLRSMGALAHSSLLGALTLFAVTAVLIVQCIAALRHGGLAFVAATTTAPSTDALDTIILSRWAVIPTFLAAPIAIFALGNHCQMPIVFLEAPPGSRASQRIAHAVLGAVGSCVVLYMITGTAGYIAYRRNVHGDVLLNMPLGDVATDVAKALLCLHVALAYPVLLFPGRETLRNAAGAYLAARESRVGVSPRLAAALRLCSTHTLPVAAALTLVSSLFAVAIPQVAIVFGLLGATVATSQSHALPALLLLRWADALEGKAAPAWRRSDDDTQSAAEAAAVRTWASVRGAYGGDSAAVKRGEGENVERMRDSAPLLGGSTSDGAEGMTDYDGAPLYLPQLLHTSSPASLRAQGWALFACSFVVCIVGTGASLYTTFGGG